MIKNVFLDFNGTILDDLDLCIDLLNRMLNDQNKPLIPKNVYKEIFTFPIIDYYTKAGLDFEIESFPSLAHKFMNRYIYDYKKCSLIKGVKPTLKFLRDMGCKTYILSASKQNILNEQCLFFGLTRYFDNIIGINDIYASSKEEIFINFIKENNINVNESIFVGDTLHDYEVAKKANMRCILVKSGHQSENVLKTSGVKIIDDINNLRDEF